MNVFVEKQSPQWILKQRLVWLNAKRKAVKQDGLVHFHYDGHNIYLLLNDSFTLVVQTQSWTILSIIGSVKGVGKMKDLKNDAGELALNRLSLPGKSQDQNYYIYGYIFPQQLVSPTYIGLNKKFDPISDFFLVSPPWFQVF